MKSLEPTKSARVPRDPERLPQGYSITLSEAVSWLILGKARNREHIQRLSKSKLNRIGSKLLDLLSSGLIEARGKRELDGEWGFGEEQQILAQDFRGSVGFRWGLDGLEANLEPGPDSFSRFEDARSQRGWYQIRLVREQLVAHARTLLETIGLNLREGTAELGSEEQRRGGIHERRGRWMERQFPDCCRGGLQWKAIARQYCDDPENKADGSVNGDAFRKSIGLYKKFQRAR